jgi:DNA polymerase elongation subunit (family B)
LVDIVKKPRAKWNVLWESPSRPQGVSEEKTREKPGEKKGAENDLPYASRYVISGDATSGDVISGDFTIPLKCAPGST